MDRWINRESVQLLDNIDQHGLGRICIRHSSDKDWKNYLESDESLRPSRTKAKKILSDYKDFEMNYFSNNLQVGEDCG